MNPHTDKTSQPQPALGRTIRELRQKRGASLKTVAADAGITLNMLSLIERGEGNPTWATVSGIAGALGISVADLARSAQELKD